MPKFYAETRHVKCSKCGRDSQQPEYAAMTRKSKCCDAHYIIPHRFKTEQQRREHFRKLATKKGWDR